MWFIDEVLTHDWQAAAQLPSRRFDAVYAFERTPSAAALVDRIPAGHKAGLAFGGPHHGLYPMGEAAAQFFRHPQTPGRLRAGFPGPWC